MARALCGWKAAAASLAAGAALLAAVALGFAEGPDASVLLAVGRLRGHALSAAMVWLTHFGSWPLLVLLSLVFGALWGRGPALFLLAAMAGAGLWSTLLKALVQRARPSIIEPLVHYADASFPSGHASLAAAFYGALGILLARRLARRLLWIIALALTVLIVGFSRVYLGAHYPSDVLAGYALGFSWLSLLCFLRAHLTHGGDDGVP